MKRFNPISLFLVPQGGKFSGGFSIESPEKYLKAIIMDWRCEVGNPLTACVGRL